MEILGLFFYVILAFVMGGIGADRKVGFWFPFLFSIFLTPIVGLLIAVTSRRLTEKDSETHTNAALKQKEQAAKLGMVGTEIEKLRTLLDQGHITKEEFDKGKQSILNQ